jgi:hypothetical protein
LTQCGNSDDPASTAAGTTGSTNTAAPEPDAATGGPNPAGLPGAAAGAGAGAAVQGALTPDGTSLLPVAQGAGPNGGLTSQVGKTATAQGVLVQSVPADEGFWAGNSETDRMWCSSAALASPATWCSRAIASTSPARSRRTTPASPPRPAWTPPMGDDQLDQQGSHIEVAKSELRRSAA